MTIGELVEKLQALPQDAQVTFLYDGRANKNVDFAWLAQGQHVVLAQLHDPVYHDEDRPDGAPSEKQDRYWEPRE